MDSADKGGSTLSFLTGPGTTKEAAHWRWVAIFCWEHCGGEQREKSLSGDVGAQKTKGVSRSELSPSSFLGNQPEAGNLPRNLYQFI